MVLSSLDRTAMMRCPQSDRSAKELVHYFGGTRHFVVESDREAHAVGEVRCRKSSRCNAVFQQVVVGQQVIEAETADDTVRIQT